MLFQSTHPSWGATENNGGKNKTSLDFNPRTHRGVRRRYSSQEANFISYFNPRTHRGVRRVSKCFR